MKKPVQCKHCGSPLHYSYACYTQRKPITVKTVKPHPGMKQRKPISKTGKHYYKWLKTKQRWFEINKAPYYACHYCHKIMTRTQLTLDHKVPRSRAPELRYALANLVPACWDCNGLKGSVAHDDYIHDCYS